MVCVRIGSYRLIKYYGDFPESTRIAGLMRISCADDSFCRLIAAKVEEDTIEAMHLRVK